MTTTHNHAAGTAGTEIVTIVIVPRERFSLIPQCVEHIYAFTSEPFKVLLLDANSPKPVRLWFENWGESHPNFKVISSPRYLYPYEAKNLALEHLKDTSGWIVFVDNDVKVSPHWLTWLLRAAQETGAKVLHPLYFLEHKGRVEIHMADGQFKKGRKNGKQIIQPVMKFVGQHISEAQNFKRIEDDFLEFHTFLIHKSVLDEMSEFEPFTLAEDVNYSFKLKEIGEKIVFEPRSVITYVAGPPFEPYDLPFFKFRWNPVQGKTSVEKLKATWPVFDKYCDEKLSWAQFHLSRVSPFFQLKRGIRKRYLWCGDVLKAVRRRTAALFGASMSMVKPGKLKA
ncbi:MAG: glycosyltransferase [Candidatus Omnitrophica bacterium]|nr:glycosyltransferase [Candidatus Omnitrophota bacterium]